MNEYEIGRIIGKIEIMLKDIIDAKKEIEQLERYLKHGYQIIDLAKIYGRIEQKLIECNADDSIKANIEKIFNDLYIKDIEEFKNTPLDELYLRNISLKPFKENGIYTVEDILNKTEDELLKINGIHESTISKINYKLKDKDLKIKK